MSERDYFISFAQQLGELNGNISAVLQRLEKGDAKMADHEARLAMLEHGKRPQGGGLVESMKRHAGVVLWIITALIAVILKLTGATAPTC